MRQNREERLKKLLGSFKAGWPYKTSELADKSNNLSRDLDEMVSMGWLKRPSPGIYYKPKKTWFGELPVHREKLLKKFLKTSDFLLLDFNKYNTLGLGTTQLHNKLVVYNRKRHGQFMLDGITYEFKRVSHFPKKLDQEFLLVDMINNFKLLGEDFEQLWLSVKRNWDKFDSKKVLKLVSKFGKIKTQKLMFELSQENGNVSA